MRAEHGKTVYTNGFLNLSEQFLCRSYLTQQGKREFYDFLFFGGFPYAERRMLFCFPDYLAASYAYDPAGDVSRALLDDCIAADAFAAITITGSGYRSLSHRDYLGALLALGIERNTIGDIAVLDPYQAVITARKNICDYLLSTVERIGADKVRTAPYAMEDVLQMPDVRRFETITDTIASPRLDAVIAACANISRDKAKQTVLAGLVDVNFRLTAAPDTEIKENTYLSIRGVGRFLYEGIDGTSKKGRLRILAKKFI